MNTVHLQKSVGDQTDRQQEVDWGEDYIEEDTQHEEVLGPFGDWKERERAHHRKHRLVRKLRVTIKD